MTQPGTAFAMLTVVETPRSDGAICLLRTARFDGEKVCVLSAGSAS